jgi:hypothetical protein
VNLNGNILVGQEIKDFFKEFSGEYIDYEDKFDKDQTTVNKIISTETIKFKGRAQKLGKNKLLSPLVSASKTSQSKKLFGQKITLISSFQALTNSRIIFISNPLIFKNNPQNSDFQSTKT